MKISARIILCLAAGLGTIAPVVPAQTSVPPRTVPTAEETVILTPFTVEAEKDEGYVAADTTMGGRLSMNLLKAPSDVSVLTREFMNDVGALSVLEAAAWLTSSTVTEIGAQSSASAPDNRDFGGNVSFRGLGNTVNTRDYFTYPSSVNEYIVERVEGARGSNAIVYGDGGAGGQMNIITKRAVQRNFVNLNLRTDTEGTLRSAIDINRRLSPTVAARLNAFWQDRRTWIDGYFDRGRGVDLAVTYRPWWGASFRCEGETARTNRAPFRHVYRDGVSLWNHSTYVEAPLTAAPPAATGLARYATDRLEISPSFAGVFNLRNFARSSGNGLTIIDQPRPEFGANPPVIPFRGFRINAREESTLFETYNAGLFLEQAFRSGLVVEVALSLNGVMRNQLTFPDYEYVYRDVNAVLPNGQPNPNKGKYFVAGAYQESYIPEYFNNYRVAAAYPWKTEWFKQTFSVVAMRRVKNSDPRTYGYARIKDPTNAAISSNLADAGNQLNFRRYFDAANAPLAIQRSVPLVAIDGYEFLRYASRHDVADTRLDSIQANFVGEYFNERLTLVVGVRADRSQNFNRTGLFTSGVHLTDRFATLHTKASSRSVGLTYFDRSWWGIYGNFTEGFRPQATVNYWIGERGDVLVSPSRTYGYGLRLRLLEGRVVGSIGGYQSREQDSLSQVSGVRDQVNAIWNSLNLAQNNIPSPFNSIDDTIDRAGRGWEADLTVNVGRRLRLKMNVAFPQAKQSNALPDLKAYVARYLNPWEAGRTPDNTAIISTNIANLQNTITNANDGRDLNGLYQWRANFFGNYTVAGGRLAGLRCGLGANLYGQRLIGNALGRAFDYLYAKQYYTATATAGYSLKLGRTPVDLSLYISNLFDYDKPNYLGTHVVGSVAVPSYLSYVSPRLVSLSVTFHY